MKLKLSKRMFLIPVFVLACVQAGAQGRVSGTVTDRNDDSPIQGVTVVVKGTSTGTITDAAGKYDIAAGSGSVLVFQYSGYDAREIAVGTQTVINVIMTPDAYFIDDVVITALGISRDQKSLGYAVTKVDGEEVVRSGSGNWLDGLSGKVAGLNLSQAGTGPMSSMRVTIRGDQSLNYANNQVLVVVDGVPVSSGGTETSSGSNYSNTDAPVDFGNGLSDLNPDDIESINVLKGAAATALYGARAGNGALIITTKSGRTEKGIGVTFSSTTSFDRVMGWPDFQTEYGGGNDMGATTYSFWTVSAAQAPDGVGISRNQGRYGFGEKYEPGMLRYSYASKNFETGEYTLLPWEYHDNWFKGLFQTGVTTKNVISVDGNTGRGTIMRLSITDVRSRWVLPNTPSSSQTFSLNASHQVNKYITLKATVNYLRRDSDNVPWSGYGNKNPIYSLIWATSNNDHEAGFKAEYFSGRYNEATQEAGELFYQSENSYNPYFSLYEEINTVDRDRVYGNFSATIKFMEGLELDLRSALDMNNEFRTQRSPQFSGANKGGFFREQTIRSYEINNDFLLRYNNFNLFDTRLGLSAGFGGNNWQRKYARVSVRVPRLEVDKQYNLENLASGYTLDVAGYRSWEMMNSFYGYANFSWDDYLFLDITGRNDWTSTLNPGFNSYFYPSVGLSILLNEAFDWDISAPWLDLLKLRASWANVGIATSPYALQEVLSSTDYAGGYRLSTNISNPDLRPENIESWEFGLDIRLFHKLSVDLAYYYTSATDQIINVSSDIMTGAATRTINAGDIQNRGVEIAATYTPFQNRNGFSWSMSANWSRNWNTLVSMDADWNPDSPLQTAMGTTIGSRVYVYSYLGEEMHWIYGKDYVTAPEGSYYIDANGNQVDCSGMKIINSTSGRPSITSDINHRIAKVNPDWRGGMSHTFSYKNWSLRMDFAAQMGGHAFSATHFALAYQGKLKNSLPGRYDGLVVEGVNEVVDSEGNVSYQPNTTVVDEIAGYYNSVKYVRDNVRENTFKTDFLKMKSLKLDYEFPSKLLEKTGFLQGASVGLFVYNVFCISQWPQFDPETGNYQGTNIYGGIETGALPMTRTYGFNIKLSF